jgi:hypothetical protein
MNLQKYIPELAFLPAMMAARYTHRLYKNYEYTDSVRASMCEKSSSWVVERIFALQLDERIRFYNGVQLWDLRMLPDGAALFTCADTSGEILYYEHFYPEGIPSEDVSFALQWGVLNVRKISKVS